MKRLKNTTTSVCVEGDLSTKVTLILIAHFKTLLQSHVTIGELQNIARMPKNSHYLETKILTNLRGVKA